MNKLFKFKRVMAIIMSAVMMTSVFGASAFAAETNTEAQLESLDVYNVEYDFINATSSEITLYGGFRIDTFGSYKISFCGAQGSGAVVNFYKKGGNSNPVHSLSIPPYVSGMPATLYVNFDFEPGDYYVRVKAYSNTSNSTGSFTIYGVADIIQE